MADRIPNSLSAVAMTILVSHHRPDVNFDSTGKLIIGLELLDHGAAEARPGTDLREP